MASGSPLLRRRLLAAALIGLAGGCIGWLEFDRNGPGHRSDFSPLWYAAGAMVDGQDPYELIGPGKTFDNSWPTYYPATAFVAALPFAWLPADWASAVFTGVSTFLLALAVTRQGWYRLPLFLSVSYVMAARASQLSPLLAASLFFPWLGFIYLMKPNIGLALLGGAPRGDTFKWTALGSAALLLASLWFLPSWPETWFDLTATLPQQDFPIAQWGGPLVLLALLRWRHWESWLLIGLACVPQTVYWYEGLYLLLIPATYRQSLLLSLSSSLGFLLERTLVGWEPVAYRYAGEIIIASLYLPAVWMLLRRPVEGAPPAWLRIAASKRRSRAGISPGIG